MAADSNIDFLENDDSKIIWEIQILKREFKISDFDSVKNLHTMFDKLFHYDNKIFEIINTYYEHHKKYEVTFGDRFLYNGEFLPVEQVLTDPGEWDIAVSLDHIWEIRMKKIKSSF